MSAEHAGGTPVEDVVEAAGVSGPGAALRQRLAELAEEGGRGFDAPACDIIASLLARAEALGGAAALRLRSRAEARLDALEARFERGRREAAQLLAQLVALEPEQSAGLAERLEHGDFSSIARAGVRQRARQALAPAAAARASSTRYRDALADLACSLSRAGERPAPREQSGLLNGSLLAAGILTAAETLSPAYRRSLVTDLLDLAPLLHLPALPLPRKRV